jgi:uncharacterized RDD family membrane protein YckC
MSVPLQFETPENVRIEHHPAGLGTRFVAWFVDGIIVNVLLFLTLVVFIIVTAVLDVAYREWFPDFERLVKDEQDRVAPEKLVMYVMGIGMLIWSFSSFFYFVFTELFWRGQTPGKRLCKIRVVKSDGFALDAGSICVRNVFRVADQLPFLWIVPFLSKRGQRFGDMVAGTILVSDEAAVLPQVREELSSRSLAESRFRFDNAKLSRLSRDDVETVEQILERWESIPAEQRNRLLEQITGPLCRKMQTEEPPLDQRVEFFEDLLTAEYHREDRNLR